MWLRGMSAGKGRMITDWVAWTKRAEAREVSVRSMVELVMLMSDYAVD